MCSQPVVEDTLQVKFLTLSKEDEDTLRKVIFDIWFANRTDLSDDYIRSDIETHVVRRMVEIHKRAIPFLSNYITLRGCPR